MKMRDFKWQNSKKRWNQWDGDYADWSHGGQSRGLVRVGEAPLRRAQAAAPLHAVAPLRWSPHRAAQPGADLVTFRSVFAARRISSVLHTSQSCRMPKISRIWDRLSEGNDSETVLREFFEPNELSISGRRQRRAGRCGRSAFRPL